MASLELYINKQLCEIENPENFSIYLKRQLLNPAELSTKDAQRSYDISLPATATNNAIFGYTNTEEVKGKFSQLYDAQLLANGTKIFDGKFKISEIGKDYYKGNLGIPAAKTVKDIFGEMKMNQAGKWLVDFTRIEDVTTYNTKENSECIFPFVLYSLMPKRDTNKTYTPKNVYDASVVFGLENFPPSVNCLQMLEQIFKNSGYSLTGSAMTDERLKNLYVSYKNPENYEKLWGIGSLKISGTWGNYMNGVIDNYHINNTEIPGIPRGYITGNFFNSKNIRNLKKSESGTNISISKEGDTTNTVFKIPQTGLYKLFFKAVYRGKTEGLEDPAGMSIFQGSLANPIYEAKVLRYTDSDFLDSQMIDNIYCYNNINQNLGDANNIYPKAHAVNFVDPKQNPHLICGLSWGGEDASIEIITPYDNLLVGNGKFHNPIAISGGLSWSYGNKENDVKERFYSAVKSDGYFSLNNLDTPRKFIVELEDIPAEMRTHTTRTDDWNGTGQVSQIIWLEKDECITIVSTSRLAALKGRTDAWYNHEIDFELTLEPFTPYRNWLKMDDKGSSTDSMHWTDKAVFDVGKMNLIKLLPSAIKVNDWIDNFCKAFNLNIINTGETNFELNVKSRNIITRATNIIDLDKCANVNQRSNESLKLPYLYDIGFTIDTNEEGYYSTLKEYVKDENGNEADEKAFNSGMTGGGKYYTGSSETTAITQTSTFSYCWYKDLFANEEDAKQGINPIVSIPVIMEHEAWEKDYDYADMMDKYYSDKAQRFWYKSGLFDIPIEGTPLKFALVSNSYTNRDKKLFLNYENEADSILNEYFLLLLNSENNYTIVDCMLSPDEYNNLKTSLVNFNGDLYNVAEIDGYDPLEKKRGKLKLIRKII